MHLSQERVAEMSGLSLRTVQRLEAGHRVSYASLRALAVAFKADVDSLERELYAVNNEASDEFVEIPRWVRLVSDKLSFAGPRFRRRDFYVVEAFCIACGVIVFAVSFSLENSAAAHALRAFALLPIVCGYLVSLNIRFNDRYKIWPGSAHAAAERPRTWRSIVAEYAYLLGLGVLSVAAALWLAS